jgi:hypothetical protein
LSLEMEVEGQQEGCHEWDDGRTGLELEAADAISPAPMAAVTI